jgi:hypothetical protein
MIRCTRIVALLVVSLLVSGCEDKKAKDALESAKQMAKNANVKLSELAAKGKDAVQEAAKDQAADLDQTIADFKERAAKTSGDAKVKIDDGIKSLESQKKTLVEKLSQLKDAGADSWKKLAEEIDDIVASMRRTISEIRAKF